MNQLHEAMQVEQKVLSVQMQHMRQLQDLELKIKESDQMLSDIRSIMAQKRKELNLLTAATAAASRSPVSRCSPAKGVKCGVKPYLKRTQK